MTPTDAEGFESRPLTAASDGAKAQVKRVHEVLKTAGFRRHGKTWNRQVGEFTDVVDLQGSQWGGVGYLNTGVFHTRFDDLWGGPLTSQVVPEYRCVVRDLHEPYSYNDPDAPDAIAECLTTYVLPFFERMHSLAAFEVWLDQRKATGGAEHTFYLAAAKSLLGDQEGAARVIAEARNKCTSRIIEGKLAELKSKLGL